MSSKSKVTGSLAEPPVSLIVPTYRRQDILCETIQSALKQRWREFEIVVIDQTPSTPAFLDALISQNQDLVRYYKQLEPNLPKARNTGVRLARFDILLFIDDDVILPESFVESHVRRLLDDESTGAVTGPAVAEPFDGDSPDLSAFIKIFDLDAAAVRSGFSEASWFHGCNFSTRRSVLERAGPFDESFTGSAYCEDVDMGVRVRESGFRVVFDRDAWLIHLALQSGGCETRNPAQAEQRARERFRHLLYCRLKHRKIQGAALSTKLICRAYRSYLLNRSALANGAGCVFSRTRATAIESFKVLHRLKETQTSHREWSKQPL